MLPTHQFLLIFPSCIDAQNVNLSFHSSTPLKRHIHVFFDKLSLKFDHFSLAMLQSAPQIRRSGKTREFRTPPPFRSLPTPHIIEPSVRAAPHCLANGLAAQQINKSSFIPSHRHWRDHFSHETERFQASFYTENGNPLTVNNPSTYITTRKPCD